MHRTLAGLMLAASFGWSCGSSGNLATPAGPDAGSDGEGPARDASSDSHVAMDSGPMCGALGESCCAGGMCGGTLTCTGGTCGCVESSDCPAGGSCTAGRCLITLGRDQSGPYAITIDADNIYWANEGFSGPGTVVKAPLVGGAPTTLVSSAAQPQEELQGIAVDAANVYWTAGQNVMKTSLEGGAASTLYAGSGGIRITASPTGVYWTAYEPMGAVMRAPAGGGPVVTLFIGAPDVHPWGIAVDSTNVYWASDSGGTAPLPPGAVGKVFVDGGTAATLASRPNANPAAIAVDATSAYWAESIYSAPSGSVASILKVPLSGGAPTTLVTGQTDAQNIAVDATSVYWTNVTDGTVMKVPVGGGTPVTLFQGDKPWDIKVDATSIYWSSPSGGTVMRLSPK